MKKDSRSKTFSLVGKLLTSIAMFFIWPSWILLWILNIVATAIVSRISSVNLLGIWLSVTLIEFVLIIVLVHCVQDLYNKKRHF